mmetsp:Transcript_2170/g.3125  ORF Transcript_2170/g.3125 Transcript_2170/m.3125 type:complete len:307 (-) Transcript_2170:183-1103(-)|eukprot:CAMPEP_0178912024 /NCGR_PEP_ID=MMETSP0786-20121207/10026_1 /TAXON_ID=186022 /ORGANISM="Thalassionema frauenfeldii, Strain CCMP 1798" /LENGTH=306 /DNA_ID=CAMNT_0020584547 /DNA_START=87 /DNA_END=1007 /DNA_ORIENTATION=-
MAPLRLTAQRAAPRFMNIVQRGMATEKQIFNQMVSTKNIQKITSSMKMVSAAKLKGDETRMKLAEPFNVWSSALRADPVECEDATYEDVPGNKCLVVPFTSESGLCGGVNSFISKNTKKCIASLSEQGKDVNVVIVGEKGRSALRRPLGDKIVGSATGVVYPGNFALCSSLSQDVMAEFNSGEYDSIVFLYNHYVNPAVYKQMYQVVSKPQAENGEGEIMPEYDCDGDKDEVVENMFEYMIASQMFYCYMDAGAAEQSSRMAAMENATKNAGEMIDSLTLQYNRARQARITTELIEIISGASAIEG